MNAAPLPYQELLLRALAALVLGAAIGFERDRHRRPAGLRTHILVALGSAMFMIVSTQFAFFQGYPESSLSVVDGSRIASQVVSGAGFLVGGAILRSGFTVQGMTTAAGLWLVTAIGLAAGAGMYVVATAVTGLGMFTLWGLRTLDGKGKQRASGLITLELDEQASLGTIVETVELTGCCVLSHSYRRRYGADPRVGVTLHVRHAETFSTDVIVRSLETLPGIRSLRVQRIG